MPPWTEVHSISRFSLCVAGLAAAVVGCSNPAVYGGRSEARDVLETRVTLMTWLARNYGLRNLPESPAAYCLRVRPKTRDRKPGDGLRPLSLDPTPRLLSRLTGLHLPVLPQSACDWDDSREERIAATQERAVAVDLSYPDWNTLNQLDVVVRIRDHQLAATRITCELVRDQVTGWRVRRCS